MSLFCIFQTGLHIFDIFVAYSVHSKFRIWFFVIGIVRVCIIFFGYFLLYPAYYFAYLLSYSIFCILFCIFMIAIMILVFCIYMSNMQNTIDLSLFCIWLFYFIFCILLYIFYFIFCIFQWICCIFLHILPIVWHILWSVLLHILWHILHFFKHIPASFAYYFPYFAYFLCIILHIMMCIRLNNPVAFVHWLCSTHTRQAWTTSGCGQHQGSSLRLVMHKGLDRLDDRYSKQCHPCLACGT